MNKRILVIEDDKDICEILKYNLEKERGISVLTSASGDEGLKLALEARPHLIILDLVLPGMRELLARIRAAMRRKGDESDRVEAYDDGTLMIDFENYQIRCHGRELKLTFKEFNLLKVLVANAGRVLTREKILDAVWGYNYYGETRTVDVHIRRIRKKLAREADKYIETVIGVGYRFRSTKGDNDVSLRVSA